jgi:formate hydrogenlyase subunit 3/multisubunit Na+/H+ antiporter MnhD subunit
MLTWIICLPFAAALLTGLVPRNYRPVIRGISLLATLGSMVLALNLFWEFDAMEVDAESGFADADISYMLNGNAVIVRKTGKSDIQYGMSYVLS